MTRDGLEIREFNTLIVNEPQQLVSIGPTSRGQWITIEGWGAQEWDALVAIVSRSGGYPAPSDVHYANRKVAITRKVVYRIRERFRRCLGHAVGSSVVVTNRSTSAIYLNPTITPRFFPVRHRSVTPTAVHEPRAYDSMLDAIMRAAYEVFGARGVDHAIDLLPADARIETVEQRVSAGQWISVRYITNWMRAIHGGPAHLSPEAYEHFVRRVELYRLSPRFVDYVRCQQLRLDGIRRMWRHCYDSGDFEASLSPKNDVMELRLWNHPYCVDQRSANVFAVCWRFIAEHLHAKETRVDLCAVEPETGALRIRIGGSFTAG